MTVPTPRLLLAAAVALALSACTKPKPAAASQGPEMHAEPAAGLIAIPDAVRKNLGIEFHTVGRQRVAGTLRVPGHFELLPQARSDHRMPLAGRITVHVAPLAPVAPGDLLFSIDSPEWRRTQHELAELRAALEVGETRLRTLEPLLIAHEEHERSLEEACRVLDARVGELERMREAVGGQAAELAAARVQFAQMRAERTEAAEKHTEAMALRAELTTRIAADRERHRLLLATAQSQLGLSLEDLLAVDSRGLAHWQRLDVVEVRASAAGVVQSVECGNGAWLDTGAHVLEVIAPDRVRFVGKALQSDLPRLDAGQAVRLVAPSAASANPGANRLPAGHGALQLGALADAVQRTLPIAVSLTEVPAWARHGIAAVAEVETEASAPNALVIPLAAIQQQGLDRIFFLRNPRNPDEVMRVDADLGTSDGRWVEVKSGITDGDEVVVAGAYALMLASGPQQKGGHFHADGTWHADDDHQ
jgi:multidrug efflux pump subunit AcrA (membrane-fusion protein)